MAAGDFNCERLYCAEEIVPGVVAFPLQAGVQIVGGVFTPSSPGNAFALDTEGLAASDDLTAIDMSGFPGVDDNVFVFNGRQLSSSRDITVVNGSGSGKAGAGNIRTSTGANLTVGGTSVLLRFTWLPRSSDTGVVIVEQVN